MSKVGFVGLGIMGAPMAGHLLAAGHELYAYDIRPVPPALVEQGAQACASATEVAQKADVIITMVAGICATRSCSSTLRRSPDRVAARPGGRSSANTCNAGQMRQEQCAGR